VQTVSREGKKVMKQLDNGKLAQRSTTKGMQGDFDHLKESER